MTSEQDDWKDSALVRALRAPGTDAELAGEERAVAAFRAASLRHRGVVRRLGTSGTAAVAILALSGGVAAAAYTNRLPDPVQRIAHTTLAKVGVPAPQPAPLVAAPSKDTESETGPSTPAGAPTSARPTGKSTRSPSPTRPSETATKTSVNSAAVPLPSPSEPEPTSESSAASPSASLTPSSTRSASPSSSATSSVSPTSTTTPSSSGSPTASPTGSTGPSLPPRAAAVTIDLTSRRVDEGGSVLVTGVVTDAAGKPMSGRPVRLLGKSAAQPGRQVLTRGRTDAAGAVTLLSPGLADTSRLRLRTKGARSVAIRVVVVPPLAAAYADGRVTVTTSSAHSGETVTLRARPAGTSVEAILDQTGQASFSVVAEEQVVSYDLLLAASPRHAAARVTLVVPQASPSPGSG
ncbi:hypothetical protein [Nocardioides sp.]|uniref:hypothetical protein n=1 Tax=Nocardioides sp. TaxID=35761 RepID=UPI0039E4F18D